MLRAEKIIDHRQVLTYYSFKFWISMEQWEKYVLSAGCTWCKYFMHGDLLEKIWAIPHRPFSFSQSSGENFVRMFLGYKIFKCQHIKNRENRRLCVESICHITGSIHIVRNFSLILRTVFLNQFYKFCFKNSCITYAHF